jgi:glutamyl-tRNA reductase
VEDRQLVEQVLRGYANKLLHQPLVQIRELANGDDGYLRLDTVRRIFNLEMDGDGEGDSES